MTPFELAEPKSLSEALALLDPDDASVRPIAGGTALMLMMKTGVFRPQRLVSLRGLSALAQIETAADGALKIGALTPLAIVERSDAVSAHAPVITQTLRTLSNRRVRNVATIGGSLAHADPHMDLPPVLVALGAHVVVASPSGERTIAVEDLFAGYFETVLARDELITAVVVPAQAGRATYLKCTTRAVHDWPALGVAVAIQTDAGRVSAGRVVISAATEKPTRLGAVEQKLSGLPLGRPDAAAAALREIGDAAAGETEATAPLIADGQGSVPYKRELVRVYVRRAVQAALAADAAGNGRH